MQIDAIVPRDCGETSISAFWQWLSTTENDRVPDEHVPAFRTLFKQLNMYCNSKAANGDLWGLLGFDNETAIQVLKHTIMRGPGYYENISSVEEVEEIRMAQIEAEDFARIINRRTPSNADCAQWMRE